MRRAGRGRAGYDNTFSSLPLRLWSDPGSQIRSLKAETRGFIASKHPCLFVQFGALGDLEITCYYHRCVADRCEYAKDFSVGLSTFRNYFFHFDVLDFQNGGRSPM